MKFVTRFYHNIQNLIYEQLYTEIPISREKSPKCTKNLRQVQVREVEIRSRQKTR